MTCSATVSHVPNRKSPDVTLALHTEGWNAVTERAGLATELDQAKALHISRQTINRVRNRRAAPGPEFIAAAMRAFPKARFEEMFTVVPKVLAS